MSEPTAEPTPERIRVRKRKRSRRRRRQRLLAVLGVLLGIGLVAAASGAVLYRDGRAAQRSLEEARAAMSRLQASLASGELEPARAAVASARTSVTSAAQRTNGPLWRAASVVPVAGRSVTTVRNVVAVAGSAVEVGNVAVERGAALVGPDGLRGVSVAAGRIDLRVLTAAERALASLPVDRLQRTRDDLAKVPTAGVPGIVADGRETSLELADQVLTTVANARTALSFLPGFLGAERPRDYLVAIQNPAELRGTGGLIGYSSTLTTDAGALRLGATANVPDDVGGPVIEERSGYLDEPVPAPPAFVERYGRFYSDSILQNVNFDPDLPTVGPVLLEMEEVRSGERPDGAILVDVFGMGRLLEVVGSLEVPADVVDPAGRLPTRIEPSDFARVATVDVYEVFGDGFTAERAAYQEALSQAAFEAVFAGEWNVAAMAQAVGRAAAGRHLQVFSSDAEERDRLGRLGVGGELRGRGTSDLLAVTANNWVGGKQDVHLGNRFTGEFTVSLDGSVRRSGLGAVREGTLRTEIVNPLPASGVDRYIIGNCLTDLGRDACFEGPDGWNRTWLTLWQASGTSLEAVRASDEERPAEEGAIHGHVAFDVFLETPPESTGWAEHDLTAPVTLEEDGDDLVYRLTWWRQAKGVPDVLDLRLRLPEGLEVVSAAGRGGGDGTGLGALGDTGPATVSVVGDEVRVAGGVTEDLVVEVRLRERRGAIRARLDAWLERLR